MKFSNHSKLTALAAVLLIADGCAQARQNGEESPQALLAAAHKASADHDGAAIMRLIAPSKLPTMPFTSTSPPRRRGSISLLS